MVLDVGSLQNSDDYFISKLKNKNVAKTDDRRTNVDESVQISYINTDSKNTCESLNEVGSYSDNDKNGSISEGESTISFSFNFKDIGNFYLFVYQ